ncbi:amino acid adenylation domain protein [Pseudodesulfovibrio mercurii]|uniref:Amino acid adenylation domain protein n=1 Tax=Pseudodesulfovibrio mercurii TaxID=641491 RepID=F0JDX4_9BACT|nr:amino acid adenylation domain-containing protein [Pseudodesulfovibrio mercurii]EGB13414.1 amino acid adenylation domain protein [Pseudodesulfovibrio mercurii]
MKTDSLISGFIRSADSYPDNLALFVDDTPYTYRELASRVQCIAHEILGKDNDSRQIGIYAYRSIHMYSAILAALLSGHCYVPLSPIFPQKRVQNTIAKAGTKIILTDGAHLASLLELLAESDESHSIIVLGEHEEGLHIPDQISLTSIPESRLKALSAEDAPLGMPTVDPGDIAYLLFTSGSTGDPKGVGITHRNALSMIAASIDRYQFNQEDSFTQLFDFTFDLSVFDIFVPLTVGGSIFCVPKGEMMLPHRFVNKHKLSVWFSVPAVAVFLSKFKLLKPDSLPHLRLALFCGEALLESSARDFALAAPNAILENLYGPTEATVYFTYYTYSPGTELGAEYKGIVPIGKPLPGLEAAIVDPNLKPVADGEVGELCLAGPQLAPGYWRNPGLTNTKFCPLNTSAREQDNRWYRTGDLARLDANGDIVFIGRIDDQIQIAGHRVELGEIEHLLRKSARLEHLVAIGHRPTPDIPYEILVFYSGSPETDLDAVCKENLPTYMQVKRFYQVETMPLNANGKVDRKALLARLAE